VNSAEETTKPFYERPLFQGAAAVVALVTALLALVGPLGDAIDGLSGNRPQPSAWTEVVLNTSSVMGERFGGGEETALKSAVHAMEKMIKELDSHGVGLRSTPIRCDERSRKLVDVTEGSAGTVIEEAKEQIPNGNASIVDAVAGGMTEFDREPMQSQPARAKSLLVFTTAAPPCELDELVEDQARSKLERVKKIGAVEVFALESEEDQEMVAFGEQGASELDFLQTELDSQVQIHYVETPEELYQEAEAAGEAVREAAEEVDDENRNGTSEEGGPE
jgi:hypothetical protein